MVRKLHSTYTQIIWDRLVLRPNVNLFPLRDFLFDRAVQRRPGPGQELWIWPAYRDQPEWGQSCSIKYCNSKKFILFSFVWLFCLVLLFHVCAVRKRYFQQWQTCCLTLPPSVPFPNSWSPTSTGRSPLTWPTTCLTSGLWLRRAAGPWRSKSVSDSSVLSSSYVFLMLPQVKSEISPSVPTTAVMQRMCPDHITALSSHFFFFYCCWPEYIQRATQFQPPHARNE